MPQREYASFSDIGTCLENSLRYQKLFQPYIQSTLKNATSLSTQCWTPYRPLADLGGKRVKSKLDLKRQEMCYCPKIHLRHHCPRAARFPPSLKDIVIVIIQSSVSQPARFTYIHTSSSLADSESLESGLDVILPVSLSECLSSKPVDVKVTDIL